MSDQLETQSDKISELEKILDDKKDVLRKTEDILPRDAEARAHVRTVQREAASGRHREGEQRIEETLGPILRHTSPESATTLPTSQPTTTATAAASTATII